MEAPAGPGSAQYDWREADSPSDGVLTAVAEVTGRSPADLPPIAGSVDEAAMNRLIATPGEDSDCPVRIAFEYAGCDVTVESDGPIEIDSSRGNGSDGSVVPRTEDELSTTLKRLFTAAAEHDVSVEGGWAVRNGPALPDWDIHVTQLVKPERRD